MGSDWSALRLEDAGVTLLDCVHKTPPDAGKGVPYIAIPQMKNGHIDFSASPRLISREHYIEWTKKAKPQHNDVVLSRRCNPGETAYVPPEVKFALGQNLVLLRSDGAKVYPPFLRWLVKGPTWWEQVGKFINVGAVFDSLKCADIPEFELPIPPIHEQKAIAHILGTPDGRIELNRQMNETLEAMAQALFKSWFVDFDPVIDNALANGKEIPEELSEKAQARAALGDKRRPLPEEIRALFPDEFIHNEELGWIPKGWSCGSILEGAKLLSGGTPKTSISEYWDGDIPWASAKDVSQCGEAFLVTSDRNITLAGLDNSSTKIISKFTTVFVARGATTGRLTMFGDDMAMNQTCYGLRADSGMHFYTFCHSKHFIDSIVNAGHGSVFITITTKTFEASKVIHADKMVISNFEKLVSPIFNKVLSNQEKNRNFIKLRDTLLPKLLYGELRIPDAEKMVERIDG